MTDKKISLSKVLSVPDTAGNSNFGGIASDGTNIFCVKANQAETSATVHVFTSKTDKTSEKHTIKGLGHANGLTYHADYLYVPMWGSKHSTKGLCKISTKDWSHKTIKGAFAPANISHYKDNLFIMRTATSSNKKVQTFAIVEVGTTAYKKKYEFKVINPKVSAGYTTNQDIFFKDGKLYIMETKADIKHSAVLVAQIGEPAKGKTYSCESVWLSSASSKWEIESMCMLNDGTVLFGMNTSADGVYEVKTVDYTAEKAIEIAKAEVGYLEKKTDNTKYLYNKTANAGSKNYTKYGHDTGLGCGVYWCAEFVSWVIYSLCGKDKTKAKEIMCGAMSAACETIRSNMKSKSRYGSTPKKGAFIFFSGTRHAGANHIGIVYDFDSTYVYTVEGNTSGASGVVDNGGGVAKKKYSRKYTKILGYGYPKYDTITETVETTVPYNAKVTAEELNVRVGPGADYEKCATFGPLKKNEVVTVEKVFDSWCFAKTSEGKHGYCSLKYLEKI